MSDRAFRVVMATLATASVAIAAYLVEVHYSGGSVVCSTGGCETVQHSAYAEIFGAPVAFLGLLGSLAILVTLFRSDRPWRVAGFTLAVAGLVFAGYLVIVQLAVLGAVCEWCVANDAIVAILAGVAGWRAYATDRSGRSSSSPVTTAGASSNA
jgi:uncharacterized membrane protein